jgi:hypothetical protein
MRFPRKTSLGRRSCATRMARPPQPTSLRRCSGCTQTAARDSGVIVELQWSDSRTRPLPKPLDSQKGNVITGRFERHRAKTKRGRDPGIKIELTPLGVSGSKSTRALNLAPRRIHAAEFTNMSGWWLGSMRDGGTAWRELRRELRLATPYLFLARVSSP